MKVFFEDPHLSTRSRTEVIDFTHNVEGVKQRSGINDGHCVIQDPHSTTAITVNENKVGLTKDIVKESQQVFRKGAGCLQFRINDNTYANLPSSFIGLTRTFPVKGGRRMRGKWQNIFLLELDGPRT